MSLAPGAPPNSSPTPRRRVEVVGTVIGSAMALVTVTGDVDAANAQLLVESVEPRIECVNRLIVDLRSLGFFGTQGFSSLHRINVMISRRGVNWVVVPGPEVDRVLRICDPDGGLPVARSLDEAMATVSRPPRNHLRLVTSS